MARATKGTWRRIEGALLVAAAAAVVLIAARDLLAAALAHLWLPALAAAAATAAAAAASWQARRMLRRRRARRAVRRTDLHHVDAMSGRQFEEFVADLMLRDGFTAVAVVGRAGDGGVDIRARTPQGHRCAVQCKRLSRPAQPKEVREFLGALATTHRGHSGLLVSSNGFTARAREEAAGHLTLVGREELARWARQGAPPVLPQR